MDSYASELDVSFGVILSCPHVIDPERQVFARVVKKSLNRQPLTFNWQSRSNQAMCQDLGNSVINLANHVPAGMLVFFPSYSFMESCIDLWKNSMFEDDLTFFQKLELKKTISVEKKDRRAQEANLQRFLKNYKKGAVFFGVCGGKLSEGIDFADDMARCVIIIGALVRLCEGVYQIRPTKLFSTEFRWILNHSCGRWFAIMYKHECIGIPYGNFKDIKIQSKIEYMNTVAKKCPGDSKINGSTWYETKALRAMNQALGRIIRHRQDFGAVLLFDERMAPQHKIGQLSSWVREHVKVEELLIKLIKPLREFFQDREAVSGVTQMELEAAHQAQEVEESNNFPRRGTAALMEESNGHSRPIAPRKARRSYELSGLSNPMSLNNLGGFAEEEPRSNQIVGEAPERDLIKFDTGSESNNTDGEDMVPADSDWSRKAINSKVLPAGFSPSRRQIGLDKENRNPGMSTAGSLKEIQPNLQVTSLGAFAEEPDERSSTTQMKLQLTPAKLEPSQEPSLQCRICFTGKTKVKSAPCGHICCSDCWDEYFKYNADKSKKGKPTVCCPICKRPDISMKQLTQLYI